MDIALLGCGVVGSGVCRVIEQNSADIARRLGEDIRIKKVLERRTEDAKKLGFEDNQICRDMRDILADEDIRIVVETLGGVDFAFECDVAALQSGRHVVTSNKDLVEMHWDALHQAAAQSGTGFYYEAAVCGAIPIIQSLKSSLAANRVEKIIGILNGTSNYILTQMFQEGLSYEEGLRRAQQLGFAEKDPSSDVEGYDAARKLAILSRLAYRTKVGLKDVYVEGITQISPEDITKAREMGYVIKLLGVSQCTRDGVFAFVRPALVPEEHPIAGVHLEHNAVFLRCDAAGDLMLYGKGAGSMPTASAVTGDIMMAARGEKEKRVRLTASVCYEDRPTISVEETWNPYYLRMTVKDKPLVLAGISTVLGQHNISMASLIQRPHKDGTATLILITHPAMEKAVRSAIEELQRNKIVEKVMLMICVTG